MDSLGGPGMYVGRGRLGGCADRVGILPYNVTTTANSLLTMSRNLTLKVQFSGGLELLFSKQRDLDVTIPSVASKGDGKEGPVDINFLIRWLTENRLAERPELFTENSTV